MAPDGVLKGALDDINALRHRYGAKALRWDDQLYADARQEAQKLAREDNGLHHTAENVCENFAMSAANHNYDYVLVDAVRQWWAGERGKEWIYFNQPEAPYERWGHFGKSSQCSLLHPFTFMLTCR
jgi:hypothetical protein